MVLFVLTREGYCDVSALIPSHPTWINADVLSETEIKALREGGADLSTFTAPIDPLEWSEIQNAIETIALHHPGERIWVETTVDPDALY
jgi:hypothetical protein